MRTLTVSGTKEVAERAEVRRKARRYVILVYQVCIELVILMFDFLE